MSLRTPIEDVSRISDKYAKRLKRLGVNNLGKLLFHFPRRHKDHSQITPAGKAEVGEAVCVEGRIMKIKNKRTSRQKMVLTKALLKDDSGWLQAIWFRQPYLKETLDTKRRVSLAGKVELGKEGPFLSNPVYEKLGNSPRLHTGRLVPVYPQTEGVSSRWLRYVLFPLLEEYAPRMPETLPEKMLEKEDLLPLSRALMEIHFPENEELLKKAKRRFAFEELFLLELKVLREKRKTKKKDAHPVPSSENTIKKFESTLPFELTGAQKRSAEEILKDISEKKPMRRLLQGDVGSGKTVVAALAALQTGKAGFQTAFMAPTEILAKQHFQNLQKYIREPLGLLTGSESKIAEDGLVLEPKKEDLLKKIKEGKIKTVAGTHALIQDGMVFDKLALTVVDEQHRFGVKQRSKLIEERKPAPHLLTMTATPIPRSLALTAYGDLDISLIDELPPGRKKTKTSVVPEKERETIYEFVRSEIKKGRQVFVVCPRIELKNNSSWGDVKAVEEEYERLKNKTFPDLDIGKLHGQLSSEEKDEVMRRFKSGETDILVSTSVIEVGVDIPNASIMIIEGAERFGLAQLHQFRGRVGRSDFQSYCFLFSDIKTKDGEKRLRALEGSNDGFELAEKDLEIRGPGDLLGKRQSGPAGLMLSSLKNIKLVKKTRKRAKQILESSPNLKKYPKLKKRLKRFSRKVHLE